MSHIAECPEVDPISCAIQDIPVHRHHQTLDIERMSVGVAYGLGDNLEAAVEAGASSKRTGVTYRTLEGSPYVPPYGDIHHRDGETVVGFEDVSLLLRLGSGKRFGRHFFQGEIGVSLPTGGVVPNPYALGALGLKHQHLQFGTGTIDPRLGIFWRREGHPALFAWSAARMALAHNREGFRAGPTASVAFGSSFPLGGGFESAIQIGALVEGGDDWLGIHDEGSGRRALWSSLGVSVPVAHGVTARPELRWTFASSSSGTAEGEEIRQPLIATVVMSATF